MKLIKTDKATADNEGPIGLAEFMLKKDTAFVIGSEAIFAKDTPKTQGTGDSMFLLFNAIADRKNIPLDERPKTEQGWQLLIGDINPIKECEGAWASLNIEHDIEPYISKELVDFLENGIKQRIIRTVFTTAIDETLELIINTICINHKRTFKAYNFMDGSTDQKVAFLNVNEDEQVSLVYIFGKIGDREDSYGQAMIPFVYSDDDAIREIGEYIKGAEENNSPIRKIFYERSIMAIGCKYDDWKFRFFWYSIRGKDNMSNKAVAFSCTDTNNDTLYKYLKQKGAKGLQVEVDTRGFMQTMADMIKNEEVYQKIRDKRWQDAHGLFISYASDDILTASDLFHYFSDECHFKTWMDCSNLKPQDRYSELIEDAIHKCDVFVPILSTQVMRDLTANPPVVDRYYMKEWKYAHSEGKTIFPICVGNYNVREKYHDIFKEICGFVGKEDIHVRTINDKVEIKDVLRKILSEKYE